MLISVQAITPLSKHGRRNTRCRGGGRLPNIFGKYGFSGPDPEYPNTGERGVGGVGIECLWHHLRGGGVV